MQQRRFATPPNFFDGAKHHQKNCSFILIKIKLPMKSFTGSGLGYVR
jgi:hypothetical protein